MKLMETEIVRPNATTTRIRLRYLVEEKETVLVVAVDVPWTARTSGKIWGRAAKRASAQFRNICGRAITKEELMQVRTDFEKAIHAYSEEEKDV